MSGCCGCNLCSGKVGQALLHNKGKLAAGERKQCIWFHGSHSGQDALPGDLCQHHCLWQRDDRPHQVSLPCMLLLTSSASRNVYHCDSACPLDWWTQLVTLLCKDLSMVQTVLTSPCALQLRLSASQPFTWTIYCACTHHHHLSCPACT